ncbi:bifunctional enoyl-CoA hydratase/phosphate acetyltransferase [Aquabacterium sp.]|uniref:bifunctional enoyl-CoA hydratase/phosphate acetyltransferase n=1 Tax=Aquabacterium sp. TaxID=1872578 RepID=UPI0035B49879
MNHLNPAPLVLENRTFDEIEVGESARLTRTLTKDDIELFAVLSGDVNPAHLDEAYARETPFHKVIAHGMWGGTLISNVLGTKLPGPGTIYLSQQLKFLRPVGLGDVITVTVQAVEKRADKHIVVFDCTCTNAEGKPVITGVAEVMAPTEKVRREVPPLPEVRLKRHARFDRLLEVCKDRPAVRTAVVYPCDDTSLIGAVEAAEAGLLQPILIGPASAIQRVAQANQLDISKLELIDVSTPSLAAERGVALVRSGDAAALMKGSLHTDELLHAAMHREHGLRTGRRVSHAYVMDVPDYPRPLIITDAAINILPTLDEKRDIVQNAIDLAHVLSIDAPRVAILSAVETVSSKLSSTLDAAALCKMADRGQIKGGVLDGPLAFDNAVSLAAAHTKHIESPVAGQADVLVVPNLEAGNMLAKQLTFLANADAAGIVLGARAPIILTSRADDERTRIASAAIAVLLATSPTWAAAQGHAGD